MREKLAIVVSCLIWAGTIGRAEAGGLYLYETATEDLGLAGAGMAARAQDAATVAANPAGMSRLNGNQITLGLQALYGEFAYQLDAPDQKGPGNIVGWLPGVSSYYSNSLSEDFKLGIALYGNFGLSLNFDDDWAGRNLVKETTLLGVTVQPAAAYRISEMWSVGAGLGLNFGVFSLTRDRLLSGAEATLDDTDLAPSVKLGLLFQPSTSARLGLTWSSEVKYDFDIDAEGNLPLSGQSWSLPIDAAVGAPQQLMLSLVVDLDPKWSLLGNFGWQDWSAFSELELSIAGVTRSSGLDLQDTWHGALGAQYQMTSATRLNFGIAYDTSMYEDQDNTALTMPSGAAWRFGTGVQRQLDDNSSIGVAFEYLLVEDAYVPAPALLAGSFDDPEMFFVSINYGYRF